MRPTTEEQTLFYEEFGKARFDGEKLLSENLKRQVWIVDVTGGTGLQNRRRYVYPQEMDNVQRVCELLRLQPSDERSATLATANFLRMYQHERFPGTARQNRYGPALNMDPREDVPLDECIWSTTADDEESIGAHVLET